MKVAPIARAASSAGVGVILVHTGQHYNSMSDAFFSDLRLPEPHYNLGVGSATHAVQTANVMKAFEPVVLDEKPDWVVVVGDVNSTLAAALVTAKIGAETGTRLAHVEAGLRSNDWRMPEEINRVLTDRIADRLYLASEADRQNLLNEGIASDRIRLAGNVMIDTLHAELPRARKSSILDTLRLRHEGHVVVTLHRPSNVDHAETLREIMNGLRGVHAHMPVILPVHPRTRKRIDEFGIDVGDLRLIDPLGYHDMLALTDSAAAVLTDSGGLQEETTILGVPCVTIRESTERPVTVSEGTNRMIAWPPTAAGILVAFHDALRRGRVGLGMKAPEGWDGKASERIVHDLLS